MKRFKKSVFIPLVLLVYLLVMAYMGRDKFLAGSYVEYFGILLVTLSLRSMCQDLILNHESTSKKLRELEIRCKNIENKIN